jgi:hypothetical protein
MQGRLFRLGVPIATLLLFALLAYAHIVVLPGMSAGEATLDMRYRGYDVAEVQHYLATLSSQGATLYQGWVRVLDTVVPLFVMITLLIPLRMATGLLSKLALPAIAYCCLDLLENQAVALIFSKTAPGAVPSDALVVWASTMTQWKTATAIVAIIFAFAALLFNLRRGSERP